MKKEFYNIGVVIGNVYTNHPQELVHGICDAAKNLPVNIQFFPGTQSNAFYKNATDMVLDNNFDYQFNTIYDFALFGNLDAIIISYGTLCIFLKDEEKADFFKKYAHLPRVVLEEISESKNASWYISDNHEGISRIVDHLITRHGYHKILHVAGPKDNTDAEQRKQGYLDAMARHWLTVTEDMILYGDYSQYMDEEIEEFLLRHPDAQAICCANDDMAVSAYRVCKKLGFVVGSDIAVTGYDNLGIAAAMDPPLTTIEQNGYAIGCQALLEAWRLCEGGRAEGHVIPATAVIRESCGCGFTENVENALRRKAERREETEEAKAERDAFLQEMALNILGEDVLRKSAAENYDRYRQQLLRLLESILYQKEPLRELLGWIGQDEDCIDVFSLPEVERRMGYLLADLSAGEKSESERKRMAGEFIYAREYFQNRTRYKWEERQTDSERKAWLGPLFVRDIQEHGSDEREALEAAVKGMKRLGMKSSRILLFEKPRMQGPNDTWQCPDRLYLAAYHAGEEAKAFPEEERPVITREQGFGQFMPEKGHVAVAFSLFNLQRQYGILLCEIGPDEISDTYVISIQLGTALRFLELSRLEREAQEKLREAMEEVEKQNRILEFVSNSDPLTGLMNRRGMIERLWDEIRKRKGERAYLVFADLDHLKQINDTHGHGEGDAAICQIGRMLREIGGKKSMTARIGGDEFVMVIFGELHKEEMTAELKRKCEAYNEKSGKPYLVECSVGFVEFICEKSVKLETLFEEADRVMYHAKQKRRKSVLRN